MKIDYKKRDYNLTKEICKLREDWQKSYIKQKENLLKREKLFPNEIFNESIELDNCDYHYKYATFEFKSYCFIEFNKTKFGKSVALSEDNYTVVTSKSFYYVKFNSCCFDNIIFDGCHFIGCEFNSCNTQHGKIIFQNCCLRSRETEYVDNSLITKNICTQFVNCNMVASFNNCLADYLLFENCQLILSKFYSCEMPNTIFNKCGFYSVQFINSDINKLSIMAISKYELEFYNTQEIYDIDNEIYISYKGKSFIENVKLDTDDKSECYRNMAKMYFTLSKLLSKNNINDDLAREYTYLYNYFSMKIKKSFWEKFIFTSSWIICGFGERMGRFLFWFILFVFSNTMAYMFCGIYAGQEKIIKYTLIGGNPVSIKQFISDFLKCLHFSIITFSTVGYGNITPYGWSHLISVIQIIFGIILVAVFTSVIVKKLIK